MLSPGRELPDQRWLCRKFCSEGHAGAVAPVCTGLKRRGSRTVRPSSGPPHPPRLPAAVAGSWACVPPPATVHGAASTIVPPRLGRLSRGTALWACSPSFFTSCPCRRRRGGPGSSWSLGRAASLASRPARGGGAGSPWPCLVRDVSSLRPRRPPGRWRRGTAASQRPPRSMRSCGPGAPWKLSARVALLSRHAASEGESLPPIAS